jgi:hypothetical protein
MKTLSPVVAISASRQGCFRLNILKPFILSSLSW